MDPVLVVLDPALNAPQPALDKAARLARHWQATLLLFVNGCSPSLLRSVGPDDERMVKARIAVEHAWQERFEELIGEAGLDDWACETRFVWDRDEMQALRALIMKRRPQLVVVRSAEHHGALSRLFLAPRDWQLLRKAPCNVLCVEDTPWPETPPVVAAVDPEHEDDNGQMLRGLNGAIVRQAAALQEVLDGGLKLCHVVERPDETLIMIAGEAIPGYLRDAQTQRDFYQGRLEALCSEASLSPEQALILEGTPSVALAEYQQQQGPLLLVLGTVSRNAVGRLLLGSTAEQIVARASGDILAVKEPDFHSPWEENG